MKCPACNHDYKRRDAGLPCQSCGDQYVFDPRIDWFWTRRLTDRKFQAILYAYAASAGDTRLAWSKTRATRR